MKREEILAFCASNPEVLAYVLSLESQIKELTERLQALEARLNQNSRNSSRPPSTDFFVKEKPNPKSLRKNSGRKPGGQEGHQGATLEMTNNPDSIIEHSPSCCEECGHTLENVEVESYERRQVFICIRLRILLTQN